MNKTKVCLVVVNLGNGGAETVLTDLANRLVKKYEVHICVFDDLLLQPVSSDCKIHKLLNFRIPSFLRLLLVPFISYQLYKYLRRHQIGNIISFLERANYTNCFLKLFSTKFNHIITVNTALSQWYKRGTLSGAVGTFMVKWLYTKADTVVCCSQYIAYEMNKVFTVETKKIKTIHNGIDLEKILPLKNDQVEMNTDVYKFIHVGSFYEGKNHKLLLEGFKKFLLTSRKANLILIGGGYLREQIVSSIKEDEILKSHLILPEKVENQYAYMYQSNCLVLSSNFEGLPTVIMEAFACGLNVISTDCISGPRELLTEPIDIQKRLFEDIEIGKYGILFPVNHSDLLCKAMCKMYDTTSSMIKTKNYINESKSASFDINLMAASYEKLIKM